ncbi:MAG TPA: hypothetical protein VFV72_16825 [Candidatus Limnocylindrales bacterium]|nr:hypothetical protein [Candidatus Limnocylindrales bacterium]
MIVTLLAVVGLAAVGAALGWWAGGTFATRSERLDPTSPVRAAVVAFVLLHVVGSVALLVSGESGGPGPLLASGALAAFGAGAAGLRLWLGPPGAIGPRRTDGLSRAGLAGMAVIGLIAVGALVWQFGVPLLSPDPVLSRAGFSGLALDLFRWFVPSAAVALAALAVASRSRRDTRLAAAVVAGVAGLEILFASRALPAELALEVLLVGFWAGARVSRRAWLVLAAGALAVFVGVQLIRVAPQGLYGNAAEAVEFAARRTVDRVLLIHPRTLEVIATTIPDEEPYFGGSTYVRRIAVILGQEERPSLGFWLYERLFPGETGGFAAPSVAGEAWANGGPLLVGVVMAALGAFAAWLGRALRRLPGGPVDRAFAAVVVVAVARTYATSLNGLLLTLVVSTGWWLIASGRVRRALRG